MTSFACDFGLGICQSNYLRKQNKIHDKFNIFGEGYPRSPQLRDDDNYVRACYFTNWSQYRPGIGKFLPHKIHPFLFAHIIYAVIEIGTNNEVQNLYNQFELEVSFSFSFLYNTMLDF